MKICTLLFLTLMSAALNGQYSWWYNSNGDVTGGNLFENGPGRPMVLHDFATRTNFVLDFTHTLISAYDANGHLLWATDPWRDNHIQEYRTKRPFIVYFKYAYVHIPEWPYAQTRKWSAHSTHYFSQPFSEQTILALAIVYNNTQFGWINLYNGKYLWGGQD